ncbi:MAG: nitrogen regulation protein NR(II) [Terriglobales bacterium]
MPALRLKTKLVLAITLMVVALVAVFAYIYVSQVVRVRVAETYNDGGLFARQIFNAAREAMEVDLSSTKVHLNNPSDVHAAIREVLETDPGLNSLLQSIIGDSPIVYDAAIVDVNNVALLHTNPDLQGKTVATRPHFDRVLIGGLWHQLRIVYGRPEVYDIHLPLERGGAPFGDIRVGISTIFMKNELRPQLNHALLFSTMAILISLLLAAALSNLALRPLESIGHRLDRITAGEFESPADTHRPRSDEYGVVSTKIDRLGRQMRDVKEVFSALKENLDQIMANLQDGLMLFTRDWRVVLVSASAEQFVGRPRGEILGSHVDQVFAGTTPLAQLVSQAVTRRQPLDGYEVENGNGRRVQVSLDFIEERGERIGALLTMRDAESVRRIEDEIELSRRLAAIGRLTSGVAHEVKNPINAIVVHLEVLREKLRQIDPDTQRHMDIIGGEIHRLDRVVQTLVDFTRPVELKLVEADLRKIVDEVVLLASPEAERHGTHIERSTPAGPIPVKIDIDLVKQALLNVVLNGVQAMSEGGTLTFSARREDDSAQIDIHDEGPGIPPEIRDKVFNLYFTTKQKGSGIGLAMTYRVMQLHNGSVDFESAEGKGTTFHLRLPLLESRQDMLEQATARG